MMVQEVGSVVDGDPLARYREERWDTTRYSSGVYAYHLTAHTPVYEACAERLPGSRRKSHHLLMRRAEGRVATLWQLQPCITALESRWNRSPTNESFRFRLGKPEFLAISPLHSFSPSTSILIQFQNTDHLAEHRRSHHPLRIQ